MSEPKDQPQRLRDRLAAAAVAGIVTGAARALVDRLLDLLTSTR